MTQFDVDWTKMPVEKWNERIYDEIEYTKKIKMDHYNFDYNDAHMNEILNKIIKGEMSSSSSGKRGTEDRAGDSCDGEYSGATRQRESNQVGVSTC